jgi:hypothetical protein
VTVRGPGDARGDPGSAVRRERTLLRRLVTRRPELFTGRVICFDRNFPGHEPITSILDAGGHVIARVKEDIALSTPEIPSRLRDQDNRNRETPRLMKNPASLAHRRRSGT